MPLPAPLAWLEPQDPFPPAEQAWGIDDPAPGLLAAGGALDVEHLQRAYSSGIFPWFSAGQPILWWSPAPRMVLPVAEFKLHRSLRRTLQRFRDTPGCEIRVDHDFQNVIEACAHTPRDGQGGTWIVPDMIDAYCAFHAAGHAHSIETWQDGQLLGGLYCIGIGKAVFGESMFAHATDASKIALAALVCLCRLQGVSWIDCQQNTAHLASLGAREIDRADFLRSLERSTQETPLAWRFESVYWDALLPPSPHLE
ncbi:leucyl/phenylalanyl-tRNA--protein transferase [Acidovorax sp. NCPPB 4044]|uniref:leucyl/phenylalanyl-tRNA--protein transferase n=1 Tax=Acidovorax sp. NCPPB 4044 TaxID=2940490 RepID=UPI002304BCD3|nr:leucyl/phenylalanyl-tRNA--protein transferase [Acidovorax sp. NCPPB 4044]MDA8520749.1 leucyl/phenylalanyl-tRNA--protein transferase [Acidovorax sp. NCPPB 4044]